MAVKHSGRSSARRSRASKIKSRSLNSVPQEWRNTDQWPAIDTSQLPTDKRERVERFSRAIRLYLGPNGDLRSALEEGKLTKSNLYRLLGRCLAPADRTGTIAGWAGLIRDLRLKSYERRAEGGNGPGMFSKWLKENPRFEKLLIRLIEKGGSHDGAPMRAPSVRNVASVFIAEMKKERSGVPADAYPRTTKSCARRSIERYIASYVALNTSVTRVWFGKDVAYRQHLGSGHVSFTLRAAPFDIVGCDTHTVDCIGVLILHGPAGPQRVPITRMRLVVFICEATRAVTGYEACFEREISATHIERAYLRGTSRWTPTELTIKDLRYDQGAGLPCGAIEGLEEVNFAALHLDNAAQHFSNGIQQRLRQSVGCMVRWGPVGQWWRNAVVERFFGALTAYGFKRLPSSMGSGSQDPHRAENPVAEAVGKGIEWHELLQLLDVLISNYNAKPSKALGGRSPLDAIRDYMGSRAWIQRIRPPYSSTSLRPGIAVMTRRINGYVNARVAPYVEILEVRYSGECLSSRYDLLKSRVILHVPTDDMRTVEAFLPTGERLGVLRCLDKGWSTTAHSPQQRQLINALIHANELHVPEGGDPVAVYLADLAKKAHPADQQIMNPKVSRPASKAVELLRTTDLGPVAPPLREQPAAAANASTFTPHKTRFGVSTPKDW